MKNTTRAAAGDGVECGEAVGGLWVAQVRWSGGGATIALGRGENGGVSALGRMGHRVVSVWP